MNPVMNPGLPFIYSSTNDLQNLSHLSCPHGDYILALSDTQILNGLTSKIRVREKNNAGKEAGTLPDMVECNI